MKMTSVPWLENHKAEQGARGRAMRFGDERMEIELDESSALDIGSLRVDGVEIAPGDAVPDDGDPRIRHAVAGFLFTCGPDHIRHPEPLDDGAAGHYPLHGSLSGSRPDDIIERQSPHHREVTARIRIALAQGGEADLIRRWRFDKSTGKISLDDRLVNIGRVPFPAMMMYHMNIGAHLFGEHTKLTGASFEDGGIGWRFGEGDSKVFCVPAVPEAGVAAIRLGPIEAIDGRSLQVGFYTATLPYLQMWRNQASHCNVLGIEPVSHPWKKRDELKAMGLTTPLTPGAIRTYRLLFAFR
jgi:hypothetical protein